MSTDTPISGIPLGGFSTTQSYTKDGFDDQSDIDGLIDRMEALLKHPLYGTGMALLFAMNILMPACMNFQEGILNNEVEKQRLLDDMSNKMAKLQSDFNECENGKKPSDEFAHDMLQTWWEVLKDADDSIFGRDSEDKTDLFNTLYNDTGKKMQDYLTVKIIVQPGGSPYFHKTYHTDTFEKDIQDAWEKAGEVTEKGGDNGAAVKSFQDTFNNITSTVSGQSGSVQAAEKYRQQMHSTIQSVMKNIGQYLNSIQKNEVDATKSAGN